MVAASSFWPNMKVSEVILVSIFIIAVAIGLTKELTNN